MYCFYKTMIRRNVVFSFYAIFLTFIMNHVSGSKIEEEGIIGGFYGKEEQFTYQVVVLGKFNHTSDHRLMCGGGIIGPDLILTAAQCFIDGSYYIRPLRFSIMTALHFVNPKNQYLIDVDLIYLPRHEEIVTQNDIAVAKLEKRIDHNNPHLMILNIPFAGQKFNGLIGIVAGHGYNWVETDFDTKLGKKRRIAGGTDYKLRYGFAEIIEDEFCQHMYDNIDTNKHACGRMLIETPGKLTGFCTRDTGSPLVIKNKVVGIVSRNTPECNDTVIGGIYTKVSGFWDFISLIKEDLPLTSVNILHNPILPV